MADEQVLYEYRDVLALGPGEATTLVLEHQLDFSLSEVHDYFVRVVFGEEYETALFNVMPLFEYELALPDHVGEGRVFLAELTIRNLDWTSLRDIIVTLDLPLEIVPLDQPAKEIPALRPGEEITVVWELWAASETVVAPLEFFITTANGGETIVYDGVVVQGDEVDVSFIRPGWPSASVLAAERDFVLSGTAGKPCAECTD